MQTLSRLSLRRRGSARVVAAWLAIAALIGTLAGPTPARASCASRAMAARTCSHCRHASPAAMPAARHARCALARTPCCGCAISAEREPASTTGAFQLDRPSSRGYALPAAHAASRGVALPEPARFLAAAGPPGAPPGVAILTPILRL